MANMSAKLSKALATGELALFNRTNGEILLYYPEGKTMAHLVLAPMSTTVLTTFAPAAAWRKSPNLASVAARRDVRVVKVPEKKLSLHEAQIEHAQRDRLERDRLAKEAEKRAAAAEIARKQALAAQEQVKEEQVETKPAKGSNKKSK